MNLKISVDLESVWTSTAGGDLLRWDESGSDHSLPLGQWHRIGNIADIQKKERFHE